MQLRRIGDLMGEAKRRAAAGIREGERPLPVDRLEFHDGETHDKLTRAMLAPESPDRSRSTRRVPRVVAAG